MSLRGNAFIMMMKTAELRDCNIPPDSGDRPREWTVLADDLDELVGYVAAEANHARDKKLEKSWVGCTLG